MTGAAPGVAKLPGVDPPSVRVNGLPPPKPPPPPKAEVVEPFIVAKGDGADPSLLPKERVGLGRFGGAAGVLLGVPRDANGDAEFGAPPPKTLFLAPTEANGDAEDEASLEKPEEAKADADVSTVLVFLLDVSAAEVFDDVVV